MMKKRKVVLLLLMFLILILPNALIVKAYVHQSKFKGDKLRILFLYYNASSLEGEIKYNTKNNAGLEFTISHELEMLEVDYEIVHFETCKSHINKTFLNSFDLIIVGGIYYWWEFSSNEDRVALYQTSTPIIASVYYGVSTNASLLNIITGVRNDKIEILPREATLIFFTNNSQKIIRGRWYFFNRPAFNFYLIKTNITGSAKVFAYGIREGKRFPLLIFNGTKNFLINTPTYRNLEDYYDFWEWPKLVLVALDYLFDLLPDEILVLKIFPRSELVVFHVTSNFWLIVNLGLIIPLYTVAIFFIFLIRHQAIDIEYRKKFRVQVKIYMNRFRKVILRMQQTLLTLMIASFFTYSFNLNVVPPIQEILQQIVIAILMVTVILYILDSKLSKDDHTVKQNL